MCQGNALLRDHHGIGTMQLQQLLTFDNEGYHCDGLHNQQTQLPVLTSMYCLRAPRSGGETFFACSRDALARASTELRDLARRLSVHYECAWPAGSALVHDMQICYMHL